MLQGAKIDVEGMSQLLLDLGTAPAIVLKNTGGQADILAKARKAQFADFCVSPKIRQRRNKDAYLLISDARWCGSALLARGVLAKLPPEFKSWPFF